MSRIRTIATIGAKDDPDTEVFRVLRYLHDAGMRIIPVSPKLDTLFGEPAVRRVDAITEPVDVVQIFRRSEAVPAHLGEILGMHPSPPLVWLSIGIRNDAVADRLIEAGIDVVQDRCLKSEHQLWVASASDG